jgi:hypothetical protein
MQCYATALINKVEINIITALCFVLHFSLELPKKAVDGGANINIGGGWIKSGSMFPVTPDPKKVNT